jgi:hypothetical protein
MQTTPLLKHKKGFFLDSTVASRRALLSARMMAGVSSSRESSMSVLEARELLPSALKFCTQASNQHGSKHNPNFVGPMRIQSCCMNQCRIQRNSKEEFHIDHRISSAHSKHA